MAELPTYRSVGIQYGELPRISTAELEMQAKGWGTITEKLDLLGKAVQTKVEEKVALEAQQYAIENPVTYEQLQEAMQGKQGIASLAPEGAGSIYRKALFEAQGTILAADLRMRGLREFSDLKQLAKKGEVSAEDAYQRMADLRDGYAATLRSLDPESAKNLSTILTTKANSVYEDALEFEVKQGNLQLKRQYDQAIEDNRGFVRDAFLKPRNDPERGWINPDVLVESYKGDISSSQLALGTNDYLEKWDTMVQEERYNALKDVIVDKDSFVSPSAFKARMAAKQLGAYQYVYDGLTLEQKDKLNTHLQTMINVERKSVGDDLSAMNKIMVEGGIVTDEDIKAINSRINSLGADSGDLNEKFTSFAYSHGILNQWVGLPPSVVNANIQSMRKGLPNQGKEGVDTQIEIDAIATAEKLYKNMVSGIEKDALNFAAGHKLIELEQMNFADPVSVANLAQTRIVQSEQIKSIYGKSNLLTEAERNQFKSLYDQQDRIGKMTLLGSLNSEFGEYAGDVIAELAPKDPQLAHIGGLVTIGANEAANTALKGFEYITLGQKPADLTPQNIQPAFTNFVGSAFVNNQEARSTTFETAKAIYTAKAVDQAVDLFDANLWQASIQEAIGYDASNGNGGIQAVRGQNVILPRNLDAERFEGIIDNLTPENLQRATNQEVDEMMLSQIREDEDWYPIVDSSGLYFFAKGTPGTSGFRYFADKDNNPVFLNMEDRSWYEEPVEATVDVGAVVVEDMRVAP